MILRIRMRSARGEKPTSYHCNAQNYDQRRRPSEQLRALSFFRRHGLTIHHDFAQDKSGGEAAEMREVVDAREKQSPYGDVYQPANDLAAEHLHGRASAACGDRQHHSNQT